jgi:hypothetical protein
MLKPGLEVSSVETLSVTLDGTLGLHFSLKSFNCGLLFKKKHPEFPSHAKAARRVKSLLATTQDCRNKCIMLYNSFNDEERNYRRHPHRGQDRAQRVPHQGGLVPAVQLLARAAMPSPHGARRKGRGARRHRARVEPLRPLVLHDHARWRRRQNRRRGEEFLDGRMRGACHVT